MMERSVREKLNRLYGLILQEREAARSLDMKRLTAVMEEKEVAVRDLSSVTLPDPAECDEDDYEAQEEAEEVRALADRIREENRRNAYLFWAGLNWVRDTMEFFRSQAPPPVYDAWGGTIQAAPGGRLLSGRI